MPAHADAERFAALPAADTAEEITPKKRDDAVAGKGANVVLAASVRRARVASRAVTAADGAISIGADVSAVSAEAAVNRVVSSTLRAIVGCRVSGGAETPALEAADKIQSAV
jgi:hypothetical protein